MRLREEARHDLVPPGLVPPGLVPPGPAPFASCHASTLAALPGGRLLAAFFAGAREGAGDTAIWLCRGGPSGWDAPVRLLAEPGLPHWNPVLHAEGGRVWLFHKVGRSVHGWTTRVARSEDGGAGWTAPRPLVPGETAPRGPVRSKLLVLSDGAWLAPASVEDDRRWDAFTDRSTDRGASWTRADVPLAHTTAGSDPGAACWEGLAAAALWETDPARVFRWDGVIQPTLWEDSRGVHMLLRSTRGRVFRSDSTDGGRSWCEAYPTALPGNNSALDVARLPDGRLLLAFNPVSGNWAPRTPLVLAASDDGGGTWRTAAELEAGPGEFSYPALVADGTAVHVTYTANRTGIVHRRFAVADG